jgi:raffinose/stachyose/melibiose transport system substrate-binding protein
MGGSKLPLYPDAHTPTAGRSGCPTRSPLHALLVLPLLATALPTALAVTAANAQDKKVLTLWAGDYTPSSLLPAGNNPDEPAIEGIGPVVEAYEQLHPDVDIQIIAQPINSDTRRWMVTQLTGEVAPDIMWTQPDWAMEDYDKGWLVALEPWLSKPNPYVDAGEPGSEKWHDQFLTSMDFWTAPDGNHYVVLADQLQTGFYYNKDLFEQAGITEVPETWEQLMDAAQKLQDAGIFPFATSGNNLDQVTWVSGWLSQFYFHDMIDTLDTDGDGAVTAMETAQAVEEGTYSFDDPRNRERLEQLKRYSEYWQSGALGANMDAARRLFVTGRAGMFLNGTWNYQSIKQDPQRDFELGVFYYPKLDSGTSDMLSDDIPITNKSTGYGSLQYAVTSSAERNDVVDTAMDFLMFLTTPENLTPMIVEGGFALPAVKNTEGNPDLAEFAPSIAAPPAAFQSDDSMLDFEFAQAFLAIITPYLSGSQDIDETVRRLDEAAADAADRVLEG